MVVILIPLLLFLYAAIQFWLEARRAPLFVEYWQQKANEPIPPDAIRLVALGDSATQAIGASQPEEGFVGRIARYIQSQTARPVHITNLSVGGATAEEIVREQLPQIAVNEADIIIVASSSDMEAFRPVDNYRTNLKALLAALPADKTVISDLPLLPWRDTYQQVLQEEADALDITRADFAAAFNSARRFDIFSWYVPHLNSRGYEIWFQAFLPGVERVMENMR